MSTTNLSAVSGATGNVISLPSDVVLNSPGRVLQIQQTVYADSATFTAGPNFAAVPGLDCVITPRYTTSRVMVILSLLYSQQYWQTRIRLLRNGSVVTDALGQANGLRERVTLNSIWYDGGPTNIYVLYYMGFQYLDSPASTSAVTYGIDIGGYSLSYSNYINRNAAYQNFADYDATPISTMTLMEIAA